MARPVPMILLVGCPADLVVACREACSRFAVGVEECDLGGAAAAVSARRPFAIIMTEDQYRLDAGRLDLAVREVEASLMRLDLDDLRHVDAKRLIAEAIVESAATVRESGVRPAVC